MKYLNQLFCTKCGRSMENKLIFHMYDDETGNKLFMVYTKCLGKRWYNFHSAFRRTLVTKDFSGRVLSEFYLLVDEDGNIVNG